MIDFENILEDDDTIEAIAIAASPCRKGNRCHLYKTCPYCGNLEKVKTGYHLLEATAKSEHLYHLGLTLPYHDDVRSQLIRFNAAFSTLKRRRFWKHVNGYAVTKEISPTGKLHGHIVIDSDQSLEEYSLEIYQAWVTSGGGHEGFKLERIASEDHRKHVCFYGDPTGHIRISEPELAEEFAADTKRLQLRRLCGTFAQVKKARELDFKERMREEQEQEHYSPTTCIYNSCSDTSSPTSPLPNAKKEEETSVSEASSDLAVAVGDFLNLYLSQKSEEKHIISHETRRRLIFPEDTERILWEANEVNEPNPYDWLHNWT